MNIFISNHSEIDVLFHVGDGNYKLLRPTERISVDCSDQATLNLHVKHTHASTICEPVFKYGFQKIVDNLLLKQQRDYHMAISSVYLFSDLKNMDEIIITNKTFNDEEHAFYDCILANSNRGFPISMFHEVSDSEYIKRTYKKKRRNIALWLFTIGFLIEAALISLGFWVLIALINVMDDPNEFPFWMVLVGVFFLIALIPNIIHLINTYRNDKFISNMKSQSISNFIFGIAYKGSLK